MSDYRQGLLAGAEQLGLRLTEQQADLLLDYMALLIKWNKAYNLTAVREPEAMLRKHLLDSLSLQPLLNKHSSPQRLIDVGTGPGLPGIPLAILNPDKQFDLLDSNGKKTRFMVEACNRLGLSHTCVHHSRVEALQPSAPYDAVLSRAFASIEDMVNSSKHLLSPKGLFLAMKGVYPAEELSALPKPYIVLACHELQVPGLNEQRHLVVMGHSPSDSTQ